MTSQITVHDVYGGTWEFTAQREIPEQANGFIKLTDEDGITMIFNMRNVIALEIEPEDDEPEPDVTPGQVRTPWWRK